MHQRALARFQFGEVMGDVLMEDVEVKGRPPALKVVSSEGRQRAMVVPAKGRLSLTLDGAELMARFGERSVWMDDFDLRGDLLAVGVVAADPDIRPGEEVAVLRSSELRGVGVARMPAREMMAATRGVAVAVRHRRKGGEGA